MKAKRAMDNCFLSSAHLMTRALTQGVGKAKSISLLYLSRFEFTYSPGKPKQNESVCQSP